MILSCGWVWPIGAASQEYGDAARNAAPNSGRKACFDAQGGETSNEREQKVIANVQENHRFWLTEDVAYIITPEERCAFLSLGSDIDRDHFIDQFWYRRAPDPDSLENDFQREHYRRIVFANEKFATGVPGWQTDRGRLYISFGPPDRIESQGDRQGDDREARGPLERWHYRYIEGLGENVDFELLDTTGSGDYRLTSPLQHLAKIVENFPYGLPYDLGNDRRVESKGVQQIIVYVGAVQPPKVKYKDLEAMAVARIIRDQIYFRHRIEYVRATHASTMATIILDIHENQLSPPKKGEKPLAGYEIFGRITKPTGWVVSTFERWGGVGEHEEPVRHHANRQATVALEPASYQLALVVRDSDTGKTGVIYTTFAVPRYEELRKQEQYRQER
jgi:GWxTD domain-containing protein